MMECYEPRKKYLPGDFPPFLRPFYDAMEKRDINGKHTKEICLALPESVNDRVKLYLWLDQAGYKIGNSGCNSFIEALQNLNPDEQECILVDMEEREGYIMEKGFLAFHVGFYTYIGCYEFNADELEQLFGKGE